MDNSKRDLLDLLQSQIEQIESDSHSDIAQQEHDGSDMPLQHSSHLRNDNDLQRESVNCGDAYARIVKLVTFKDRSLLSMRNRLLEEGFAIEEIDSAIRKACRFHILDDSRFADSLVRCRYNQGRGKFRVERDLADEGIDPSRVPAFKELYLNNEHAQVERALALLRRRPSRAKNVYASACRKLVSNGFDYDTAVSATRIWMDEIASASQ